MSYAEFSRIAKQKQADFESTTIVQMENHFWDSKRMQQNEVLYGIDNHFSLFGDGCKMWNLNKFTNKESLIHQVCNRTYLCYLGRTYLGRIYVTMSIPILFVQDDVKMIPGIHDPYLYIGQVFSSFAIHLEDGNLNSINYNHEGAPKLWYNMRNKISNGNCAVQYWKKNICVYFFTFNRYFVPESENTKLEKLIETLHEKEQCCFEIRHKYFLIPPSVLREHNIQFARVSHLKVIIRWILVRLVQCLLLIEYLLGSRVIFRSFVLFRWCNNQENLSYRSLEDITKASTLG